MPTLEEYQLALDVSPMPLLLVSADGVIRLTNPGLEALFEYGPGELLGQNVDRLVPAELRELHPQLRRAYLRVPTKRSMGQGRDLVGVTKSGGRIALELALDPVPVGSETWALVAAVDIRARKAQDERLRIALDASASAMLMVDEHGRIRFVNRATLALFGFLEDDLLGQPIESLVPEEMRRVHPVYRASFLGVNKARPMGQGISLYARHRTGRPIPVEIALTPVETPDGRMVVATVIDLSERVEAERDITAKAEQLTATNAELSHFAYSASHDLKAPLATVAGLLELCREDLEAGALDEVRANLATAVEVVERSAHKVESILRIARAGRQKLDPEGFDAVEEVRAIWTDLTSGAAAPPRLELAAPEGARIHSERQTFGVIVENLVSNAVRYADAAKPDRWVRIGLEPRPGELRLTVSDNGLGIPAEGLPLLFQMFKRIDDRSQDGLGLALVHKHVQRLGGGIAVASTPGTGTEFAVTLPLTSGDLP